MGKTIRLPGFGGNYYSKQKGILEREVAVLLENAHPVKVPGQVYGIVAPSDKQIISGGVAARAYGQLVDQDIEYVVIIFTFKSHLFRRDFLFIMEMLIPHHWGM